MEPKVILIGSGPEISDVVKALNHSSKSMIIAGIIEFVEKIKINNVGELANQLADLEPCYSLKEPHTESYNSRTATKTLNQRNSMPPNEYGKLLRKSKHKSQKSSYKSPINNTSYQF